MSVDWGTVPAWVGSVLTGGSFVLGFSILKRDRRKAEEGQARQITGLVNFVKQGSRERVDSRCELTIYNASSSPIYDVFAFLTPYSSLRNALQVSQPGTLMARPRI
jgi:hypothetical protein